MNTILSLIMLRRSASKWSNEVNKLRVNIVLVVLQYDDDAAEESSVVPDTDERHSVVVATCAKMQA